MFNLPLKTDQKIIHDFVMNVVAQALLMHHGEVCDTMRFDKPFHRIDYLIMNLKLRAIKPLKDYQIGLVCAITSERLRILFCYSVKTNKLQSFNAQWRKLRQA